MHKYLIILLLITQLFANHENKNISLQLSWFNQFQFAGYFMANEKGFYKEKKIFVDIKPFNFDINVSNEVSKGKSDFGIGRETLLLDKTNTYPNIISLYPLFQNSPLVLISKKSSNINSINDFSGKKIMATKSDVNEVSLKAMINSHNVDLREMLYLKHSHNINDLIDDKTDIISAYISKSPYELIKKGIPFNIFNPGNFGFDMYSDFLFTSSEFINKNKNTVIDFKDASLHGWEYAFNNIDETVDLIFRKYNTQGLTKEALKYEALELKKLAYGKNKVLGEVDEYKLKRIIDLYNIMGFLNNSNKVDIKSFIFKSTKYDLSDNENEYLSKKASIKICLESNWYPYVKMDNGIVTGIISDYKEIFEKRLDTKLELILTSSRNESINFLINNKCDLTSLAYIENNENIQVSNPYIRLPFIILTKNTKEFILNYDSLKDKKIIIMNDLSKNSKILGNYSNLNVLKIDNKKEIVKEIVKENYYGYIDNVLEVTDLLNKYYTNKLEITGKFNESFDIKFAIKKENIILLNIMNKLISSFSEYENEQLLNEYTSLNYKKIVDYSLIFKLLFISSFTTLIIIYFYLRERKLKNYILNINLDLENKIKLEVEKNRKKDDILFQQNKFASMGAMIANIAHQWRQPLNRINLSVQIIDDRLRVNNFVEPIVNKKIDSIHNNIEYLSGTIDSFTSFFHPNKIKNEFNLFKIANDAVFLIDDKLKDFKVDIIINKRIILNTFENEFLQVILIILNNAVEQFEINRIKERKIMIKVVEFNNNILLIIQDNAGGIPENVITNIFDPYFTTKFKSEGTGLGLYISKLFIEDSMNGKIYVKSMKDRTSFFIEINK